MSRKTVLQVLGLFLAAVMLLMACGAPASPAPASQPTAAPAAPQPTVPPASPTTAPAAAPTTSAPTAASGTAPVTFTYAHSGPIRTLDAPVTWFGSTHWLTNLMYDCLIWRKADASGYVGQAAQSWENINPTTWRFHLRPNLTFQNGEPLDAAAVKWNIDRVRTDKTLMVQPQWTFISEVKVVDPATVDVITDKPHGYFEYDVSYNGCELLPPKYWQQVGSEAFGQKPVGSGPYKLTQMTPNDKYVFEAWDGYWAGKPEVDRIVYQVIPEKASQVAALLAGQVDMISGVPAPDIQRVKAANGITTMQLTSGRAGNLYLRTDTESGEPGIKEKYPGYQPVTMNQKIRQAISHALDRTTLAQVQGSGYPTLVRVGRFYPEGFASKFAGQDKADNWYDPDLAKQLIKDAGYDPDKGNKPKLYFDAPTNEYGGEKDVAAAIKGMLEDVGFQVELQVLDNTAYYEQVYNPGYNRELTWATLGTTPSLAPTFYTCDWWDVVYHICVQPWSDLGNQIVQTTDATKRLALWDQWWNYYLDQAQTITLYEIDTTYGMNSKFNWQPRVDGWMTFRDLTLK